MVAVKYNMQTTSHFIHQTKIIEMIVCLMLSNEQTLGQKIKTMVSDSSKTTILSSCSSEKRYWSTFYFYVMYLHSLCVRMFLVVTTDRVLTLQGRATPISSWTNSCETWASTLLVFCKFINLMLHLFHPTQPESGTYFYLKVTRQS